MSIFQPVDPRLGNDRRKALLARLMGQNPGGFNAGNALSAALGPLRGSMGVPGSGRAFRSAGDSRGAPGTVLTQPGPGIGALLQSLLGPGGVGHGIGANVGPGGVHDFLPGPGPGGGIGSPLAAGGPSHPITPVDNTPVGQAAAPQQTSPQLASGAPVSGVYGSSPAGAPGTSGGVAGPNGPQANAIEANLTGTAPNLIDLGNGLQYDPITDTVHMGGGSGAFRA